MKNLSDKEWILLKQEYAEQLKLFQVRWDYLRNPRNGREERMIILEMADAVNVVPRTTDGRFVFVRQYRFGTGTFTLELPGGLVDTGEEEDLPRAAGRELREETGYGCSSLHPLGKVGSNPVFVDAYIHHFAALDVELVGTQRLDAGEDVEVTLLTEQEVRHNLLRGAFTHPHTISGLCNYFAWQGNLFGATRD